MELEHVFILDSLICYSAYLNFITDSHYEDRLKRMETPLHEDEVKLCVF